jgi:hypothetical protein
MVGKWQLIHPNHINAIVDGYEATIEHFRDRVGSPSTGGFRTPAMARTPA